MPYRVAPTDIRRRPSGGFIMAVFAPEDENALFHSYLCRLNIGAEHQGKGHGRFAVETLCQEAMRRGQHRLTVSYHPYPHGPMSLP